MKTLTLEQVITQVRAAAQSMETIADSTSGRIQLNLHDVDAQPEVIASALTEALPGWYAASHHCGKTGAWAEIYRDQAEITAFVTVEQGQAYIARQQAAA